MAQDDDPRDSAPDLQILGDQITLQPRSYVEARRHDDQEPLMHNMARFRSEPLQYVTWIYSLLLLCNAETLVNGLLLVQVPARSVYVRLRHGMASLRQRHRATYILFWLLREDEERRCICAAPAEPHISTGR